jgi:Tfp pilus assembly protein PilO
MAGLSLEGKPWYFGLIIGLILASVIIGVVVYMFINPMDDQIRAADAQLKDLDTKIEQGRSAQRKLPQFREEVNRLKVELKKLRSILPSTRNTEEIIKKIKALVDAGNFTLRKLTFPKLAAAQGSDPYAEWPISVSVDGKYHNLATLFNHLSNFTRIINVEQISIGALPEPETTTTAKGPKK